jgi:hypothetical protein
VNSSQKSLTKQEVAGLYLMDSALIHRYHAFSLNIASNVELPELNAGHGGLVDVEVYVGSANADLDVGDDKIEFNIKDVAQFKICGGNKILVEPYPGADAEHIRVFLLGSAMGAILHQRKFLVLHANAVEINGACVAFVGASGLGKSTLASAFLKRGHRILTDDVCAVYFDDAKGPMVAPGYAQIKLWDDSAKMIGEDPSSMRPIFQRQGKYALPLGNGFSNESLPLKAVYALGTNTSSTFDLIDLRGNQKFQALLTNIYRPHFVNSIEGKRAQLEQCIRLGQCVEVKQILRPESGFLLYELTEHLLNKLNNVEM